MNASDNAFGRTSFDEPMQLKRIHLKFWSKMKLSLSDLVLQMKILLTSGPQTPPPINSKKLFFTALFLSVAPNITP